MQLVKEIIKYNKIHKIDQSVKHLATIEQAAEYLHGKLKSNDLLLLMGAGDVFRIGEKLLA